MTTLVEIRELLAKATLGPWALQHHGDMHGGVGMYWLNGRTSIGTQNPADAELIALAPELAAKYIEAADALEARDALLNDARKFIQSHCHDGVNFRRAALGKEIVAKIDAALKENPHG